MNPKNAVLFAILGVMASRWTSSYTSSWESTSRSSSNNL